MVVAEGEITGGEQPPGTVGGESTAALLREARDDDKVKALVLRVDSPGGEVFASEQIRREIVELKKAGKPVVVSMGDLAASGGYWISMNADRIYADPSTITGSIGIFGLIPTFPRALDKIGVHTDGVGTTRFAGAFDITRPLQPEVGQVIQSVIDKGYRDFTGKRRHRAQAQRRADRRSRARPRVERRAGEGARPGRRIRRPADGDRGRRRARQARQARRVPRALHREGGDAVRAVVRRLRRKPHRRRAGCGDSGMARGLLAKGCRRPKATCASSKARSQPTRGVPVKALAHCFCGF